MLKTWLGRLLFIVSAKALVVSVKAKWSVVVKWCPNANGVRQCNGAFSKSVPWDVFTQNDLKQLIYLFLILSTQTVEFWCRQNWNLAIFSQTSKNFKNYVISSRLVCTCLNAFFMLNLCMVMKWEILNFWKCCPVICIQHPCRKGKLCFAARVVCNQRSGLNNFGIGSWKETSWTLCHISIF